MYGRVNRSIGNIDTQEPNVADWNAPRFDGYDLTTKPIRQFAILVRSN